MPSCSGTNTSTHPYHHPSNHLKGSNALKNVSFQWKNNPHPLGGYSCMPYAYQHGSALIKKPPPRHRGRRNRFQRMLKSHCWAFRGQNPRGSWKRQPGRVLLCSPAPACRWGLISWSARSRHCWGRSEHSVPFCHRGAGAPNPGPHRVPAVSCQPWPCSGAGAWHGPVCLLSSSPVPGGEAAWSRMVYLERALVCTI